MIKTERLIIVPFEMKYLSDYYNGFNAEITKYQWPDPYERMDDARNVIQSFLDEMDRGETLLFSVLSTDGTFLGSVEMHGLSDECPELGVWILESEQKKGYAYEALRSLLSYAQLKHNKKEFYYEADIRNTGSMKLLHKLEEQYEISKQELEEAVTDSGKELKLQGYILKAK